MNADRLVPGGLCDGDKQPAGRRFDVYRNNVAVSLTEALRTGFPIITRLIGQQNMDGLAGAFLRAHPPSNPVMMHYGAALPAFLSKADQLAHLGYLPDIARLELAMRRAYHATDAAPIDPAILAETSAQALIGATIELAPAVQLVRSNWPIFDIWRFNTDDTAAKPQPGPQDVLITRPEFDPIVQLLPPGGAVWIQGLAQGQTIGTAHDAALADTPEFDMTTTLTLLVQDNALISIEQKG
jgi:hypothetical protein